VVVSSHSFQRLLVCIMVVYCEDFEQDQWSKVQRKKRAEESFSFGGSRGSQAAPNWEDPKAWDNPRQRCRDSQDHWDHPHAGYDIPRQARWPTTQSQAYPSIRRPVATPHHQSPVEDRKVRVKNLTRETNEYMVQSALQDVLPQQFYLEEVVLAREGNGQSKGYAFATFSAPDAAAFVRQCTVSIDRKVCLIVPYRSEEDWAKQALADEYRSAGGNADLRQLVKDFVNRYEFPKELRDMYLNSKPELAMRAVKTIEHTGRLEQGLTNDAIDYAKHELMQAKRYALPHYLQLEADRWVQQTNLDDESRRKVMNYFHSSQAEDVAHVLGRSSSYFAQEVGNKRAPVQWLAGQLLQRKQAAMSEIIDDFCRRFDFPKDVFERLKCLHPDRARRIIAKWDCVGPWRDTQHAFYDSLERTERDERARKPKAKEPEAARQQTSLADSSSEEEIDVGGKSGVAEDLQTAAIRKMAQKQQARQMTDSPGSVRSKNEVLIRCQDGQEKKVQENTEADRPRKKKPRPTHFILCVDTSGSMVLKDCRGKHGQYLTRLETVMEQCQDFMRDTTLNSEDVYSFVTFNEEFSIHIAGRPVSEALQKITSSRPQAEKQTLYSQGLEGVKRAIRQEDKRKPAQVVFFSDGQPTDDTDFMEALNKLRAKYGIRPGLKFYTMGCGQGQKFEHLQQMASISGGHFNYCGISMASIKGAFSAISASISRSRESEQQEALEARSSKPKRTSARASGTMPEIDENQEVSEPPIFEDSRPSEVFKDFNRKDLWEKMVVVETTYGFNGKDFHRKQFRQRDVQLKRKPFMKGGMRLVFGLTTLDEGSQTKWVAKRQFKDERKNASSSYEDHEAFAKSSAVAAFYAEMFQAEVEHLNLRPKVDFKFSEVGVYNKQGDADEESFHFCGEKYLSGNWVKLNNNDGYVNDHEFGAHCPIAQAFSHFTFDRSNGELMVVDLQGVCEERRQDGETLLTFKLTDPQVHCAKTAQHEQWNFGRGDFHADGMSTFFQNHRPGKWCKELKLRAEHELRPPAAIAYIPAAEEYFEDFQKWLSCAREKQKWKLNDYTTVHEFDKEQNWFPVKIWAPRAEAERAKADIDKKVEETLGQKLKQLPVGADVAVTEETLEKWKHECFHATVLPYPPDFPSAPLQSVWLIAARDAPKDILVEFLQQIEKALKALEPQMPKKCTWVRCMDTGGWNAEYYWNSKTGDTFWPQEGFSGVWQSRQQGGRTMWVNTETQETFFEDEMSDQR